MAFTESQIQSEIASLTEGESRTWAQIGALLHSIKESGYWRNEAESFSNWLESFGDKIGLKRATLWRYMSAGKKYNNLRRSAASFSVETLNYPPLEELQNHVSPENLELLEKLSRVMETEDSYCMMDEVIRGTIRRETLREKWQAFRPALKGQTARGKPYEKIRVDRSNEEQFRKIIEGEIYTALKEKGSNWMGISDPAFFKLILNVHPDIKSVGHSRYKDVEDLDLDAVALVKEDDKSPLLVHGIEIAAVFTPGIVNKIESMCWYCNCVWLAVHRNTLNMDLGLISEGIGVIALSDNEDIEVLVHPAMDSSSPYIDRTLKGLLLKAYGV